MTWREQAACRDHYAPDDFFDDRGDGAFRYARGVCSRCPVKAECLTEGHRIDAAWSLGGIGHGMWGGLTPRERARLRTGVHNSIHSAAGPAAPQRLSIDPTRPETRTA